MLGMQRGTMPGLKIKFEISSILNHGVTNQKKGQNRSRIMFILLYLA